MINFDHYYECLTQRKKEYRKMNNIRTYANHLHSEQVNIKALDAYDDKRYILEDGINTLSYGYKI